MRALLALAWRNVGRQRRRSTLLGGVIGFGVFCLTVVHGTLGGVLLSLETNVSDLLSGHILVRGVNKTDAGKDFFAFPDTEALDQAVIRLGIPHQSVNRFTEAQNAGVISETTTIYQKVIGVGPDRTSQSFENLSVVQGTKEGLWGSNHVILRESVARQLEVTVGDRVTIQVLTIHGQANALDFVVGALYRDPAVSGGWPLAYADFDRVNSLMDRALGHYAFWGLTLTDMAVAEFWASRLHADLLAHGLRLWPRATAGITDRRARDEVWEGTKYSIVTIHDVLVESIGLFDSLRMVTVAILLALFLMVFAGAMSAYRIVVLERSRECGTLRAMGMSRPRLLGLLLLEAALLGGLGATAGFLGGGTVLWLVSWASWVDCKDFSIVLQDHHLRFLVDGSSLPLGLLLGCGTTTLGALGPALRVTAQPPSKSLGAPTGAVG